MSPKRIGSLLFSLVMHQGSVTWKLMLNFRLTEGSFAILPWGRQEQDQCGQATKGMWGMSRRQQAMKGVEDCDKPGGAVKRALSPGCPNYHALNP